MTMKIERKNWGEFLDKFSRDYVDFETSVQVLSDESGAQFLSEGLPFIGLTFDDKTDSSAISVIVGHGAESHQTHLISQPAMIAFERNTENRGGMLDIEGSDGTKTLVKLTQALPAVLPHSENEQISKVSKAG